MFTAGVFTVATRWKLPSVLQQIEGETNLAYPCNGRSFCLKHKEILIHATTWRDLENLMFGETSQSHHKYCMISFIWVGELIETERRTVVTKAWGRGRGELLFSGQSLGMESPRNREWRRRRRRLKGRWRRRSHHPLCIWRMFLDAQIVHFPHS